MVVLGKVIELFSAKKGESGFPRPKKDVLYLKSGYGIEGDKFAGKRLNQTVMVVGMKAYELARESKIKLEFGSLGENILFDFDPHEFSIGSEFQIGNKAVIKITKNCTICKHLAVFGENLPEILKSNRGVYCKIVKSGNVKVGDRVVSKSSITKKNRRKEQKSYFPTFR